MARTTKIVTFSIPPAMEQQLRQVAEEDGRTVSELLREGFRLYLENREWRIKERTERRLSGQAERNEQGGATDE